MPRFIAVSTASFGPNVSNFTSQIDILVWAFYTSWITVVRKGGLNR